MRMLFAIPFAAIITIAYMKLLFWLLDKWTDNEKY